MYDDLTARAARLDHQQLLREMGRAHLAAAAPRRWRWTKALGSLLRQVRQVAIEKPQNSEPMIPAVRDAS